jgi:hypothetical protein
MLTLDMNTHTGAVSQYEGFEFKTMVHFGDMYLGAGDNGISEIGGSQDNGEGINAYFELANITLGISNVKFIRYYDIDYESAGDLELTVTFDDDPEREDTIEIESAGTGIQSVRHEGRSDIDGFSFKVKVGNVDGKDFSVDRLSVSPVVLAPGRQRQRRKA